MGTSSARPGDLDRFAAQSRGADDTLRSHKSRLRSDYANFQDGTEWGVLDITSLLAGYGTFIDYNEIDARWVAKIAAAFRHAGGDGSIKTLPDSAIHASLKAAGLLGGRAHVTFDDPVAYGMPPTTGYANDPVNTASGNFVELEDDLPFDGLLAGLRVTRMYNSRSDRTGAFGPGWSSWADARLHPRADGAEYIGPDGQRALFPRMGDGYGRVLGVNALVEPRRVRPDAEVVRRRPLGLRRGRPAGARHPRARHRRRARAQRRAAGRAAPRRRQGRARAVGRRADRRARVLGRAHRELPLRRRGRPRAGRRRRGRASLRGRRRRPRALGHRRRRRRRGRQRLRRAGPRHPPALAVRPQHPLRLPPRPRHRHQQTTPTGRPTSSSTTAPAASSRCWPATRPASTSSTTRHGNPVAVTDRKGAVTVQEWDERANLKRRVLPTGVEFTVTHDDADRVLDVSVSTGASFRHVYEGDERSPAELIDAEGGTTRLRVEGGLVREITDPDGVRLRFGFDDDGNLISRHRRGRQHGAAGARRRWRRDRRDLAARAPHHVRRRRPRAPARAPRRRPAPSGATSTRPPAA